MDTDANAPLILGFVADLMFRSKIEATARHLGFRIEFIAHPDEVIPAEVEEIEHDPGEPIGGRQGIVFDLIVDKQPALLVFDLENEAIPWKQWIPTLKSSPATRRIPILGYASHVNSEVIREAKRRGAERALARSRFTEAMAKLFDQFARIPDQAGLAAACGEPLAPLAIEGLELFNAGAYFEAHEELEDAWNADQGPGRDLYRGVLQVGVAYLQIERGNFNGANKMLLRVRQWLDPLPAVCRGIDVAQLREDARAVHAELKRLGPERIAEFDRSLFKPVVYSVAE